VKLEAIYPSSPSEVWEALTNPDAVADWLMDTDFKPVVGHQFTFTTEPRPGFNGIIDCEVLAVEPGQRLTYTWNTGQHRTTVTWLLEPHGKGTRLTLLHEGFRGAAGIVPQLILRSGWGRILRTSLPRQLGIAPLKRS
jgi:uncharacterized protein YndB with AHSA1/START domain